MSIWFEKVPYEQFKKDYIDCMKEYIEIPSDEEIKNIYNHIKLPRRSTVGSAGYDFEAPCEIHLYCPFSDGIKRIKAFRTMKFPTGIRCAMPDNVVLMLYPRSGLGTKYGERLLNSVGVIDSSYYDAENYGHIMAEIEVTKADLDLPIFSRFMQGVFVNYLTTDDDVTNTTRTGGFGSTGV